MNTISKVESEIQKWTNTKPIETWSELINLLQEFLHPNHYLIFDLKKTMVSQLGSCKDLQFLEDNLTYCQEVLTLVNKLDPGPERQVEKRSVVKIYSGYNYNSC